MKTTVATVHQQQLHWQSIWGWVVVTCLLLLALPVSAATVLLDFNSLPSTQGWTYNSLGGATETAVFSVTGTSLRQNSFGIGGTNAAYLMSGVVDPNLPFQLSVRARVTAEELVDPTDKFGLTFSVDYGPERFFFGLGKDKIRFQDTRHPNGFVILDFDNSRFHDYVLTGAPGGRGYSLSIDGVFIVSGQPSPGAENVLDFGDETFRPNTKADITRYHFTQGAPSVGGTVTGLRPQRIVCANVTTGQTRTLIPRGARLWDCEAVGLPVSPGDSIRQTITGRAD